MKIKFTELDYQEEAIQSIVQVFEGQEMYLATRKWFLRVFGENKSEVVR